MNTISKIQMIREFKLTPDEVIFIDSILEDPDIDKIVENKDFKLIIKLIDEVINEHKLNENDLLKVVYISTKLDPILICNFSEITKIQNSIYDVNNEFVYEEESDDYEEEPQVFDEDELEYREITKEEKKKQKEAVLKINNTELPELISNIFNFAYKNYPKLINGFDRSIYSDVKTKYWKKENFFSLYEIPTKTYEKIRIAEREVEELIKQKAIENEQLMINTWIENYKNWLQKMEITKCSKQNIKQFFKEKCIKASDTTIERVKNSITKNK